MTAVLLGLVCFTGCSSENKGSSTPPASTDTPQAVQDTAAAPASTSDSAAAPAAADGQTADGTIRVDDNLPADVAAKEGPNGETPESASLLQLTPEEAAKIKEGNYTAAICWHQGGDTYITKHTQFITEMLEEVGIKVIAVTDAGLSTEQQLSDIETVMAMKPDIIIGEPVDAVATRQAWQKVSEAGISLVFMDASGDGMKAGTDYVSCVSSDNYGNGVITADLMAQAIGEEGDVGMCYRNVNLYPVEQRKLGFMDTMESKYPNIKVAEATPCETAADCEDATNAMLLKNPNLKGSFGWYDEPCIVIAAAARSNGRNDFVVTGCDLGEDVALALAQNDIVTGIAAQRIKAQARALGILGCYGLLEKQAPEFVAVPGLAVTHDNVADAWRECYGEEPSAEILKAIGQ